MDFPVAPVALLFAALFILGTPAAADETIDGKACILAVAQRLPPVQGLRITHSETAPLPPDAQVPPLPAGMKPPRQVLLTIEAAAQTVVVQGICGNVPMGKGSAGQPVAQIVGVVN